MLDTEEEISSFLILHKKNEPELRAICEGMGLDIRGDKDKLIKSLMTLSIKGQADFTIPQAISLRTQSDGQEIVGATDFMKKVRRLMFETKKQKEFTLLNDKHHKYKARLNYVECDSALLNEVLDMKLMFPRSYQYELAELLQKNPTMFTVTLINKPSAYGKSFVMLHLEAKAA